MSKPLLAGMEGVFILVKDPKNSAEWYEEKLGFKRIYIENEAAVMKIEEESQTVVCLVRTVNHQPMEFPEKEESQTVVCLVRTVNHQPMKFPENNFGVGKYYNFISKDINETYRLLIERGVKVNPISGEGTTKFFTFFDPGGNPLGAC